MSRNMQDVLLGLEVIQLGEVNGRTLHQMTVDVWDARTEKILRYQITGHYNGYPDGPPERTPEDLNTIHGSEVAAEFDRLDKVAAKRIAPIMDELLRAQMAAIHGPLAKELLDNE